MDNYTEFKVGDYIPKFNVTTREGSAQYRRMAEFCNRMGYVIEEHITTIPLTVEEGSAVFDDFMDYKDVAVYMICEPPQPEPPSQREALEAERIECKQWFREMGGHDDMAIKCSVLGLDFKTKYPDLYNEGVTKRARINEIERELKEIEITERIERKEFATRQEARDAVGSLYADGSISIEQMQTLTSQIDAVYGTV